MTTTFVLATLLLGATAGAQEGEVSPVDYDGFVCAMTPEGGGERLVIRVSRTDEMVLAWRGGDHDPRSGNISLAFPSTTEHVILEGNNDKGEALGVADDWRGNLTIVEIRLVGATVLSIYPGDARISPLPGGSEFRWGQFPADYTRHMFGIRTTYSGKCDGWHQ